MKKTTNKVAEIDNMNNNTFPQTDAEIEDWIAEGELRQERELSQEYEDSGWRAQEEQEFYERSFGI